MGARLSVSQVVKLGPLYRVEEAYPDWHLNSYFEFLSNMSKNEVELDSLV